MKIEIAYAGKQRQALLSIKVGDGATIETAIAASGILNQFPEIDLAKQKIGIFGKVKTLDTVLRSGDRIEIYRPATADPAKVLKRNTDEVADAD
ncbi:MAG: RnfH family protein [Formivibrio sp.]|nr:RnfH family protein [Formivibrio sp.]